MSKKKKTNPQSPDHSFQITLITFSSIILLIGLTIILNLKPHTCANSISCITNLTGQKTPDTTGIFMGNHVTAPNLPENPELALDNARQVLGTSTETKHIYVSLNTQRLYAYQGANLVYSFPISSGKYHPTPTGDFRIWIWLKYTRMVGGSASNGTYYNLPNVPFTMYFANNTIPQNDGYSLHGAYWHNNFGHPMSHGCVNIPVADAEKLYYWTNPNAGYISYPTNVVPGTLITIYGDPPASETDYVD